MSDHALDALLAEYAPPPPTAGLAARAVAAALAIPQDSRLANGRKVAVRPRHDRRGTWLRRPLLFGGVALALAVSGAVAATLAGVRLDKLPGVEAVLAVLPFHGREAPPPSAPPPPAPPPATVPPLVEAVPARQEPAVVARAPEPPASRAPLPRDAEPPVMAPAAPPPRPEIVGARSIERPTLPPSPTLAAPPPTPPPPAVREESTASTPVEVRRAPAPAVDEQVRLQREQIERTERLRAVRQVQIERLQRIQQSRERIRRLRRD